MHLGLILDLLKKEKLYTKFSKCEFWLREVQFLRHVVNSVVIHVDPNKIKAVKNWEAPKSPKEVWGDEQEMAFQTLKDKLCNAPVLAFPDGREDFVVYCDASCQGLGCVLMQRGKPRRVRAMNITIQSSIKVKILAAQNEASEVVNAPAEMLQGLNEQMEHRSDGALYYMDQIWVPLTGSVKAEYPKPSGLLQQPEIPEIPEIPELTKYAHFLPIRVDFKMDRLARLHLNEIVARNGVPILIISDRDGRFTS
ncbi:putative reverse transcriptase domain-containing protein [Tanacetum coccineum]